MTVKSSATTPVHHSLSFDRETEEVYDAYWVEQIPNGYATTTCSCGVTTGPVPVGEAEARRVFEDHSRAIA